MAHPQSLFELPMEILEIIFSYLIVRTGVEKTLKDIEDRLDNSIRLGLVCRRFYRLVVRRLYVLCFVEFEVVLGKGRLSVTHLPTFYRKAARIKADKSDLDCWRHAEHVRDLFISDRVPEPTVEISVDPTYQVDGILGKELETQLPKFSNLRKLSSTRHHDLHLGDFLSGIGLVLAQCLTLRELRISVEYTTRDIATDVERGIVHYGPPYAPIENLEVSFVGRFDTYYTGSHWVSLWPLRVFREVLEIPSRTVQRLAFNFNIRRKRTAERPVSWWVDDIGDSRWFQDWKLSMNSQGGWEFPQVKTLTVWIRQGTWFTFDKIGCICVNPAEVEELNFWGVYHELFISGYEGSFMECFTYFSNLKLIGLFNLGTIRWLDTILQFKDRLKSLERIRVEVSPSEEKLIAKIEENFSWRCKSIQKPTNPTTRLKGQVVLILEF
ncbi:hypothetical protein TWF281_009396 [Arthrobotrys megalospora]